MAVGPFSVKYPVLFTSGGDTTSQAFHKHIQEIERIYGCLNALNADKLSASDLENSLGDVNTVLTKHINSTNPHPNYKPSVSWSDLTGTKPALSSFGGNLPASRISGLTEAINASLPENNGDGIVSSSLNDNGYITFNNGLVIQWGSKSLSRAAYDQNVATSVKFPIEFSDKCYMVTAGTGTAVDDSNNWKVDVMLQTKDVTRTGFKFIAQEYYSPEHAWTYLYCNYIAIGK